MMPDQQFRVQSRSFDGRTSWEWQASLVGRAPSLIVLRSSGGDAIASGERSVPWPADTLQFYWSDRWYNIRAALRDDEPYFYSCNVAMPAAIGEGRVSYVDLDLEVAVTEGLSARVDGEEDFKRNAALMHYPPDIVQRAYDAVQELYSLVRAGRPPFRNYEALFLRRTARL
jgi:protein associated with RNAse G/E